MLEKFTVENFRTFDHAVCLDFTAKGRFQFNAELIDNDCISKFLIYGRNGTGKTNLGKAVCDIVEVVTGKDSASLQRDDDAFLNAAADQQIVKFAYDFRFDDDLLQYRYHRNAFGQVVYEKLTLNGSDVFTSESGKVLKQDLRQLDLQDLNLDLYHEAASLSEGTQVTPFLRWMIGFSAGSKNGLLKKVFDYVRSMKYLQIPEQIYGFPSLVNSSARRISRVDPQDLQDFLGAMGFSCKLIKKEEDGQQKLYFDFGKKSILFYENASSGIRALAEFYQRLHPVIQNASLLYLDEFDAFFHYEMAQRFYRYFVEKYPHIQMIFTTHNTDLMNNTDSRPDSILILSSQFGLTPLHKATHRELREGHNLEKMYHSGEFEDKE